KAMDDLGIDDIPVVGLAKRLEELCLPDDPFPAILPRAAAALYLVQRLRDEAHRFAITFHRAKRAKSVISSDLAAIPGLGKPGQAALRQHCRSLKKIRAASVDELMDVPGVGEKLATSIKDSLEHSSLSGVNMATGEIVD